MSNILNGIRAICGVIGFNSLPKNEKQITFYSEGKNYWPHLKGLIKATLETTNIKICYISSSNNDPGLMIKHPNLKTFFIGMEYIREYFFKNISTKIMVMTMPDLEKYQLKRSKYNVHYVYVQHSLVSLHYVYRHGAFDHYDTICAAGPHHVAELKEIETKYNLPKKNIFELGYSRLDELIKIVKKSTKLKIQKKIKKKFLIAPSWGPQGLIESGLCKCLVKDLLELGHEVILRSHPQTNKFAKDKLNEIINKYMDHKRFSFEKNVTGHQTLLESDIMVSDWSGVALEYAFGFNKPVIFCNVPKKINNQNFKDIKITPIEVSIREKIGVIWNGKTPIEKTIEYCSLKTSDDHKKLKYKHCFNIGNSDFMFAKFLKEKLI